MLVNPQELYVKQKSYLNKVDESLDIFIHRGENKSYKIVNVLDNDAAINKEYIFKPDDELAKAITGEELLERLIPRIEKLFDIRKVKLHNGMCFLIYMKIKESLSI